MKALSKMLNNGKPITEIDDIIDTIELFVDSFDTFIAVFDKHYEGGDFCAGLTFGMQGMNTLEKVASNLYEHHVKQKAKDARNH